MAVKLEDNQKFEVRDASDSAVVQIDSDGNASFSGRLSSSNLETNDASISGNLNASEASVSGTLRAKKLIADEIVGLPPASPSATYISNYYLATQSAEASSSALLNNLALGDLSVNNLTINGGVTSFGTASFYDLAVASNIFIGAQFSISDTSINVLGEDLKLQPLKQGGIAFVGGEVYIDPQGNLTVAGNARFAKDVEVAGKLSANIIAPLPGKDLVVDLASGSGQLNIEGNVSSSGSATFGKLNLGLVSPALAISDTELIATGSAGTAFINPYKTEVTIINSLVTENSLIYITPVGPTAGSSMYLLRQTGNDPANGIEGSFTVGLSQPGIQNTKFNYLIVN